ncbi:hypothetical protein PUN28_020093 [Cardiocondyla obscurior]|uniref:BTB domain-containing protein n=1 Tax=Cardiocondyla obscurior TaxID=286306 RepID=A0AAW2E8F5_9HYME
MSRGSQVTSRHQDTALPKISPDEALKKYFRANNHRDIVVSLDQIKNDPNYKELIKRNDCLDILVQLLRSTDRRIVGTSLSLLADGCLTDDMRKKARDSNIDDYAVIILKDPRNATLHCRACRLISNLSRCSWHAEKLCNCGVVTGLKIILKSKTDTWTHSMAIRAVRNIWINYKSIRDLMTKLEMIKDIAELFVLAVKNSNADRRYNVLLDACLKAMCTFLQTLDPRCGNQMHVNKNMLGYKCLMYCCSTSNRMAAKCFYSLCQIAECRLSLGVFGAVEMIIEMINTADTNSNVLCKEILFSMCLFCRESVNRERIRQSDGLQIILLFLSKPEHEECHLNLLEALSQFIYDETGINILTKHGILQILVGKLTNIITKNSDKNSTSRKRPSDNSIEDYYKKPSKYCNSRYSMDYHDDWSPRSATSASSSSSPSTPPLPLYCDLNAYLDDLKDDVYSPVYSDKDCDNNEEETASPKSNKSLTTVEADSDSSSSNSEAPSEKNPCEYYTLLLLSKLSLSVTPIDNLAESTTITSLMNYIKHTKKQNPLKDVAMKILRRIVENVTYFTPLLKQGLAFDMQILPEIEECAPYLCKVAETGGAIGQLSSILLRGKEEHKLLAAISIPLLIKTQCTLKRLLKKYGGLQLIFCLLKNFVHEFHYRAVWSICQLAKNLEIHSDDYTSPETTTENNKLCELSFTNTNRRKSCKFSSVEFELDDGSIIKARRRMLCKCSPVFSVMLEGDFSESKKRRIRLKNVTYGGLKTLILAASGAASSTYTFENRNIESLLDAVLLADYFLMPDLVDTLTEKCINKLNYKNYCRAWCWARNKSCHEFKSYCLKSFLTAKMSWSETIQAFRDFYFNDAFDEFLYDIRKIIMDVLCQC